MAKYVITGEKTLKGRVKVGGNKNAILPLLASSLLTDEQVTFTNVPQISDAIVMCQLLERIGCKVRGIGTEKVVIEPRGVKNWQLPPDLVSKLRASILLMGPMLARFGKVSLRHPGGCIIGRRPVGTHFDALHQLGADIMTLETDYQGKAKNLTGTTIFLDEASVTATENALMAAVTAKGTTVIKNAACEPHVVDLTSCLIQMGANISGIGTNTLVIQGVAKLHGTTYAVRPDHIEVGTYATIAAVTGSDLVIEDVRPEDLHMIVLTLQRFGVSLTYEKSGKKTDLHVRKSQLHGVAKVNTGPWPAFPTDLMSVLLVLATQAQGVTLCHDWMYEGRMFFIEKLVTMGANIILCDPHRAVVFGHMHLRGKVMDSPDIRAGMALVVAALCAEGESEISRIEFVERGYANVTEKLRSLGAKITRSE
ncbi:MAG TPA: UDP-N-acetylglucosamine 1-carboxyvinyltransferase [Patescibacteria group bacterium]|nr:UDP-N-acetylglucosamine 1-carboxyvinyltransferase [Patescibacteria group bacterium]